MRFNESAIIILIVFRISEAVFSSIECGTQNVGTGNVFNGQEVGRMEFPWKVSIMEIQNGGSLKYICGGVLVDDITVLTAAHCIQTTIEKRRLPRQISVVLGAHNLKLTTEVGRYYAGVKSIHLNDKWNPGSADYNGDLAVIKMAESVAFSNYIRPVCLPTQETSEIVNGVVSGWGVFDDSNIPSNLPRKVELPIVSNLECFKKDEALVRIIWEEAFCAGREGSGVCKGDSGSGLYVERFGRFYLRGIVSSSVARPCTQTNYAIYSDIYKYLNFLSKFMSNSAPAITTSKPNFVTSSGASVTRVSCNRKSVDEHLEFSSGGDHQYVHLDGRCEGLIRKSSVWTKKFNNHFSCDVYPELNCNGKSSLFDQQGEYSFDFIAQSAQCYKCNNPLQSFLNSIGLGNL